MRPPRATTRWSCRSATRRDDGSVAGALLAARGGARAAGRERRAAAGSRADDRAAAVGDGAAGRLAGRPFEPAQALAGPWPSPRAAARRSAGRAIGAGRTTTAIPRARRWRCRTTAGLIDVSTLGKLLVRGPGRRRAARPAVPEPDLEPRARAGSATACCSRTPAGSPTTARSAGSTTRPSTSRRPPAARPRSSSGSRGGWPTWGLDVRAHRRHAGRRGDEPRRPAGAGHAGAGSPTSTCSNEAFKYLDAKQADGRGRPVPAAADRVRRRARLRDPLPRAARRAAVGRARRRAARGRSAWSRSGCCACRSCT